MGKIFYSDEWTLEKFGSNWVKCYLTKEAHSIVMTGAANDITKELKLGFAHRWLRMHLYHLDGASPKVRSKTAYKAMIYRPETVTRPYQFEDYLWRKYDIQAYRHIVKFGVGFEYERSNWIILVAGDNTHNIIPVIYLQALEDVR